MIVRKKIRSAAGFALFLGVLGFVGLNAGADTTVPGGTPVPRVCTASVTCNGVTITDTVNICPAGRVCAGEGGCEPTPWVVALCMPRPV